VNSRYFLLTVLLIGIEILIAFFVKDNFIRPFLGDVLVVILIFSAIRIFYSGKRLYLAAFVLLLSFCIEFSQYFRLIEVLQIEEFQWAQLILGSTFDILDLVAYSLGVAIIFFLDDILLKVNT
jgi:hypothetical protein